MKQSKGQTLGQNKLFICKAPERIGKKEKERRKKAE
jgi:hypothetical protein